METWKVMSSAEFQEGVAQFRASVRCPLRWDPLGRVLCSGGVQERADATNEKRWTVRGEKVVAGLTGRAAAERTMDLPAQEVSLLIGSSLMWTLEPYSSSQDDQPSLPPGEDLETFLSPAAAVASLSQNRVPTNGKHRSRRINCFKG
jgi:hypothetical protein